MTFGNKMTRTGAAITLFRISIEAPRSGLTPLFHEAVGLLREYDAARADYENHKDKKPDAPPEYGDEMRGEVTGWHQGMTTAHMGMLRSRCVSSATALLLYVDNAARETAKFCSKQPKDIVCGPTECGISLFETIRALGDWSRHHYEWTKQNKDNWTCGVLEKLGFAINDVVLPARVFDRFGFSVYRDFEEAMVTGIRSLVRSWKLPD